MAIFNSKQPQEDTSASSRTKTPESKISLIAAGVIIEGTVITEGDVRVEGQLNGTLICKGKLVLGATGRVHGNID